MALHDTANGADVLVLYDACGGDSSRVKRRAYFLEANAGRIVAGKKPEFVSPSLADGMKPIPILPAQAAVTNAPPAPDIYAVATLESRRFTLYRPGQSAETFVLPVYCESAGRAARVALTPFAVAGDTFIVAVVAGYIVLEGLAESQTSVRFP